MAGSGRARRGWPSKAMEPVIWAVGGRRRRMARDVADLPEPDSPTRPRVSPGLIWKEIPSTARWLWKAMVRLSTSRSGWGMEEW